VSLDPAVRSTPITMTATLATRYVLFAIFSTLANFAVQEMVLRSAPAGGLPWAIACGTAAGFVLKYWLDKKWIFSDAFVSRGTEIRKVVLYGLFSCLTTLVFWGFEVAFWTVWETDIAKYSGGAIGLAIGYVWKYALDRKYVFKPQRSATG
jgi:putative flippase GtrA